MVYGIVAEYNPFHKGHQYLIHQVKAPGDFVVAVMSGNFVQRGDFAIQSKWARTRAALEGGVDLVLELPTPFALKSAEGFAAAAIDILNQTGSVDKLVFGCEDDDLAQLRQAAVQLDSPELASKIREEIRSGISFPQAVKAASGLSILDTPNNLLAVEYLKALRRTGSSMDAIAVKRIGSGHDSLAAGQYPSASYLRAQMGDAAGTCSMERCDRAVLSILRRMTPEDFARIEDVSEGLEYRIADAAKTAASTKELYERIKSKRYTHARIRRIVLRAFLGIRADDFSAVPYLRILGFRESAAALMKQIKSCSGLPVLQQYSQLKNMSPACQALFSAECAYSDQYGLGFQSPLPCALEMTTSIVKVKDSVK